MPFLKFLAKNNCKTSQEAYSTSMPPPLSVTSTERLNIEMGQSDNASAKIHQNTPSALYYYDTCPSTVLQRTMLRRKSDVPFPLCNPVFVPFLPRAAAKSCNLYNLQNLHDVCVCLAICVAIAQYFPWINTAPLHSVCWRRTCGDLDQAAFVPDRGGHQLPAKGILK